MIDLISSRIRMKPVLLIFHPAINTHILKIKAPLEILTLVGWEDKGVDRH